MPASARQFEGQNAGCLMPIWVAASSNKWWRGRDRGDPADIVSWPLTAPGRDGLSSSAFAKSARANVDKDELATLRDIAKAWLAVDANGLAGALNKGLIEEVDCDDEKA